MSAYIGELAALATSVLFSFTSSFFTLAGRQVGAVIVNRVRLLLAATLLMLIHYFLLGNILPISATPERWLWFGLSGIVGLVVGDAFLFQAFIWIGPRLSMLMMSLAPILATILAWFLLGEILYVWQIFGILLTLGGIIWVVQERGKSVRLTATNPYHWRGILFGIGAAMGQASGLILARIGLSGNFNPISGNAIRMITAAILLWGITFIQGNASKTFSTLGKNRQAQFLLITGVITGPVLGVSFSLLAIQKTEIGVASTLMALPPVFLLPISKFFFKEQFGWGAVAGTLVAILGVGLLFLV